MKTPTASTIGLPSGLWAIGLAGLLVLLPLAILAPLAGAFGFAALAFLGTVFAAVVLHRRATGLAAAHEKLSGEIGLLSRRLLKAEAAAAAPTAPAHPSPAVAAVSASDAEALAAGIEEVTAEIGLLSGIVRELAAVVAAQEGEIARLRAEPRLVPDRPIPPDIEVAEPEMLPVRQERGSEALRPLPRTRPVPVRALAAEPPLPAKGPPSIPARPEPAARSAFGAVIDPMREAAPPHGAAPEGEIVAAFEGDGLEVWLQPVVALPQRKVVSYEALARVRIGAETLMPEAFLPVLERHGRTTALDRRMLRSAATIARHLQRRGSAAVVAYALSPLSLFEPDFLRSLAGLVAGEADLAGRVVITLPQASWRSLDAEQNAVLAALRGRIGFGLDRPADLRFDAAGLAERGVSQIKVPASLLLRPPSREVMPDIAVEDLVAALGRAGIRLVATEVEREAEVPDLIDLDLPLAQGTIFASPKAVRAEVLAQPSEPEQVVPPAQAAEPEPPPPRRAFRDFLRRAV